MQVTATEAKNRFGYVCSRAKSEPVFVEKDGRVDSVILSIEEFQAMKVAVPIKSMVQRRAEFNEKYRDWLAAQNEFVAEFGIPGEELRPW